MNNKKITDYIINNSKKVKINTQDILDGDIFIALQGKNNHGSSYIDIAIEKGAIFIITDNHTCIQNINKKILLVDDVLVFLHKIALEKKKLYSGKIIGITGSIGKTSVKENLHFFLSSLFTVSSSIKSYNNFLGVLLTLLNIDLKSDYCIFEIGTNDFFEIRELTSIIEPSQIIITNIFPTHLENLINTRNIAKEKSDIFDPRFNKNIKLAILSNNNADEEFIIEKAKKLKLRKILTFGKNLNSDVKVVKIEGIDNIFSKVFIEYQSNKLSFKLNNNQVSRIDNILACYCILIHNKVNLKILSDLSKDIPLLEGRGINKKIIFNNKKIRLIDESYNASPQSMKIIVNDFLNLKLLENHKKFLLLGDMQELGKDSLKYHLKLINYIESKNINNIILCGKLMKIALDKNNNNNNFISMLDKDTIMKYLKDNVNKNDIILIKGSNSSITKQVVGCLTKSEEN